jgi:hypothetical protein
MSEDSDIENEVDEILLKMNKKKTKVQSEEEVSLRVMQMLFL